jgi:hypothetical protein
MTDLEVYRQPAELATVSDIDSWTQIAGQVIKLANEIYDTPFVPDGLRGSVPGVAAAILAGRELGLAPLTSLANIHVIKGKPSLSAALMRALILAQGHQIETVDISDTRVVIRGRRKGESTWEEASFTKDQAARARIDLGGYPQDKLYARATSRLARRKFADVIAGMPYSAEELEDGDPGEPAAAIEAPRNGAQPAPRTARRGRAQNVPPAESAPTPPGARVGDPPPPAGGTPLPPLPGEEDPTDAPPAVSGGASGEEHTARTSSTADASEPDETDYDTPGTATRSKGGQLTAIWTVLSTVFGFSNEEKPQARAVCEHVIGRPLVGGTTGNLSRNEAKTVLDTLAHWQKLAEDDGTPPRQVLVALMAAGTPEGGSDG